MDAIGYFPNNASTQTVLVLDKEHNKNYVGERKKNYLMGLVWDHSINDLLHSFNVGSLGGIVQIHTSSIQNNTLSDVQTNAYFAIIEVNSLITKKLRRSLSVYLEADGNGYIARSVDLPLYSFEEDIQQAINSLKMDIETLITELNEDDNFSAEWLNYKAFLNSIVY